MTGIGLTLVEQDHNAKLFSPCSSDATSASNERERDMSSDRAELIKQLHRELTKLQHIFREEKSTSMDVFLREQIEQYASEEMLGKVLHAVEEEIHTRTKGDIHQHDRKP